MLSTAAAETLENDTEQPSRRGGLQSGPSTLSKHNKKAISFAAGLQPVSVPADDDNHSIARARLLAATPHIPINRKLFTDRCTSELSSSAVRRPATSLPTAVRRSQPPPLPGWQPKRRCSTAPAAFGNCLLGQQVTSVLPSVLQFETWWQEHGQQQRMGIDYYTSSKQFHIRPLGQPELWLNIRNSLGLQIDHWDLHIGAELDILGRRVGLKKASCFTTDWLDAWTKLLLRHKSRLEADLSKFTPVLQAQGLLAQFGQQCMVGEHGLQATPTDVTVTGGRVNLRHLREDIAFLAWRLRQHKAAVYLPHELEDLQPTGPAVWSIEGVSGASPAGRSSVVSRSTSACKTPHHVTTSQLLQRSFTAIGTNKGKPEQPSLGETADTLHQLMEFNRVNIWEYIQGNPLAANAAIDRRNYCSASDRQASGWLLAQTGCESGGKTPGTLTSRSSGPLTSRRPSRMGTIFK